MYVLTIRILHSSVTLVLQRTWRCSCLRPSCTALALYTMFSAAELPKPILKPTFVYVSASGMAMASRWPWKVRVLRVEARCRAWVCPGP